MSASRAASAALMAVALCAACGKKGPPLPPLVKLPAPPADLVAERRGNEVIVRFTVPATNTDRSKPANLERVDVYAFTGPATVADADFLEHGTKVGSVAVKAPRDPNQTVDEDESAEEVDAPEGKGIDQGAAARVTEELTRAALAPVDVPASPRKRAPATDNGNKPLLGPATGVRSRMYAGLGVSTRGRKGPLSKRVAVPIVPPPPPPTTPTADYDAKEIVVRWTDGAPKAANEANLLPSHPLGTPAPTIAYQVYEVSPSGAETRLTQSAVSDLTYTDTRLDWGKTRCYTVRAVETLDGMTVESDEPKAYCVTLTDTFAPAQPKGLTAVGSEGAISLIWEPNTETDLAGYLVLRGRSADAMTAITPSPIQDTNYKDTVQPNIRFFYAIVAVDKAGNKSPASLSIDEIARE